MKSDERAVGREDERANDDGDDVLRVVPPQNSKTSVEETPASSARTKSAGEGAPYPAPASTPTQTGAEGVVFDFNEGCRLALPPRETGVWRARLSDFDTGNTLFETETQGGMIRSAKRWFVRFTVEVWSIDADGEKPRLVFEHRFDAADREVLIQFPVGTLGDSIAWFSYACRFGESHPGARVTIVMAAPLIPLFCDAYPDLRFVTPEQAVESKLGETAYATYNLGLFFTDKACEWQPVDFRHVGLHKTAAYILGLDVPEQAPRLLLEDESRPIEEPYAVIAVQATSAAKMWNNPEGWHGIIAHLKARGLRVVCIDQKAWTGTGIFWNHLPHGVEDETGDRPLMERARWLRHASVFVGLASGLSWLAWAAGCPTVLISGFSLPTTEFETPGRVINWHTCNGCWNDPAFTFDHKDFLWCPRHAGTSRQFECTRLITPAFVTRAVDRALSDSSARRPS